MDALETRYVTMDVLQDCQNLLAVGVGQIVGNLAIALLCGFFISLLYRWTYRGPSYSPTFVSSIASLAMITALVIMVIGNNLARAFGLVGALSIIRFRTAVKDTQDIVYIFFALAVGMAAGVSQHLTAVVGTLFIGLSLFVLARTNYAAPRRREFLLQFSFSSSEEGEPSYLSLLEKYCKRHKIINLKSIGSGGVLELSLYVHLKDTGQSGQFVRELQRIPEVSHVNLFFDDEPF
jgi:uncharacterized membrane protein YhiD involved in acid resistance